MPEAETKRDMLRDLQMLKHEYQVRIERTSVADREQTVRLIWELSACIDRLQKELSNASGQ